jgi:hypothetical protein
MPKQNFDLERAGIDYKVPTNISTLNFFFKGSELFQLAQKVALYSLCLAGSI